VPNLPPWPVTSATHSSQTQSGDYNIISTRFWLSLTPPDASRLILTFLIAELGETNVKSNRAGDRMIVVRAAGQRSVTGKFSIKASDSLAAEGQTLVTMQRTSVSVVPRASPSEILFPRSLLMTGLCAPLEELVVVHCPTCSDRAIRYQRRHMMHSFEVSRRPRARCSSCVIRIIFKPRQTGFTKVDNGLVHNP
jgi:DNA-directed RNA polymerase subunit RPC12/RpoP